jgi:hypothetical protein
MCRMALIEHGNMGSVASATWMASAAENMCIQLILAGPRILQRRPVGQMQTLLTNLALTKYYPILVNGQYVLR